MSDSFADLESSSQDVIEITEPVIPKKAGRASRSTKNKAKPNPKTQMILDCSDIEISDTEVTIKPGVGQKTAFKKLSKLKRK